MDVEDKNRVIMLARELHQVERRMMDIKNIFRQQKFLKSKPTPEEPLQKELETLRVERVRIRKEIKQIAPPRRGLPGLSDVINRTFSRR